jgi:hypothetical protein
MSGVAAQANPNANPNPASAEGGNVVSSALDQTNAIMLVCRAVDLSGLPGMDSAANNEIVYSVERQLKATPAFDPKSVQTSQQISPVDANGTFTFTVTVTPQNPLKF